MNAMTAGLRCRLRRCTMLSGRVKTGSPSTGSSGTLISVARSTSCRSVGSGRMAIPRPILNGLLDVLDAVELRRDLHVNVVPSQETVDLTPDRQAPIERDERLIREIPRNDAVEVAESMAWQDGHDHRLALPRDYRQFAARVRERDQSKI